MASPDLCHATSLILCVPHMLHNRQETLGCFCETCPLPGPCGGLSVQHRVYAVWVWVGRGRKGLAEVAKKSLLALMYPKGHEEQLTAPTQLPQSTRWRPDQLLSTGQRILNLKTAHNMELCNISNYQISTHQRLKLFDQNLIKCSVLRTEPSLTPAGSCGEKEHVDFL